jgi:CheY-like chemotaxis protein
LYAGHRSAGMNGYELAGHLRNSSAISFVSVSGWGQEEDRLRSRKAGFAYHFVKPVEFEDIQRMLQKETAKAKQ